MGQALGKGSAEFNKAVKSFSEAELDWLHKTYKDLARRSGKKTVDKEAFLQYFPLPGMLGERLFAVFDRKKNQSINFEEFVCGLSLCFRGSEDDKCRVIFDMFNLAENGDLTRDEMVTMLNNSFLAAAMQHEQKEHHSSDEGESDSTSVNPDIVPAGIVTPDEVVSTAKIVADDAFKTCDSEHTGKLSYVEFQSWIHQHPDVLNTVFENHYLTEHTHQMMERASPLPWDRSHANENSTKPHVVGDNAIEGYMTSPSHNPLHLKKRRYFILKDDYLYKFSSATDLKPMGAYFLGHAFVDLYTDDKSDRTMKRESSMASSEDMHDISRSNSTTGRPRSASEYGSGSDEDHPPGTVAGPTPPSQGGLSRMQSVQKVQRMSSIIDDEHSAETPTTSSGGVAVNSHGTVNTNYHPSALNPHGRIRGESVSAGNGGLTPSQSLGSIEVYASGTSGANRRSLVGRPPFVGSEEHLEGEKTEKSTGSIRRTSTAKGRKTKYGLKITFSNGYERVLYADTQLDAELWYNSLKRAAKCRAIEDTYVLTEKDIGKGAFATVYEATHRVTGKRFAVKVIDKDDLVPAEREGMLAEVAILKLAHHPNIVALRDVFETPEKLYLVMELCTGGELLDVLQEGPLSEEEARPIVRQLGRGIAYLHDLGIIHRDLKPSNILFQSSGTNDVKICDFGYSKFARPTEGLHDPCGTLKYWAPEIVKKEDHNKAVDMWTLGILTYSILTGVFPFGGNDEEELLESIAKGKFNCLNSNYKALSESAKDLIRNLLKLDPSKRLTATQVLEHPWVREGASQRTSISGRDSPKTLPTILPSISSSLMHSQSERGTASTFGQFAAGLKKDIIETAHPAEKKEHHLHVHGHHYATGGPLGSAVPSPGVSAAASAVGSPDLVESPDLSRKDVPVVLIGGGSPTSTPTSTPAVTTTATEGDVACA
eukprot:Opistho-2@88994